MDNIINDLSRAIRSNQRIEYIASDTIAPDGIVVIAPTEIKEEWTILIAPNNIKPLLEMIPQARSAAVMTP